MGKDVILERLIERGLQSVIKDRENERKWLLRQPESQPHRRHLAEILGYDQDDLEELQGVEQKLEEISKPHQRRADDQYFQFHSHYFAQDTIGDPGYAPARGGKKRGKSHGAIALPDTTIDIWLDDDLVKSGALRDHYEGFMTLLHTYRECVLEGLSHLNGNGKEKHQGSFRFRIRDVHDGEGAHHHTIITAKYKTKEGGEEHNLERQFYVASKHEAKMLFNYLGLTTQYVRRQKLSTIYPLGTVKAEVHDLPQLGGARFLEIECESSNRTKAHDRIEKTARAAGIDHPSRSIGDGGYEVSRGYNSLVLSLARLQRRNA